MDQENKYGIADTSKLAYTVTLHELCKNVNLNELLREAKQYCEDLDNDDISLVIATTANFIAQLQPKSPNHSYACRICVVDKFGVGCQFGMFSIQLCDAGSWNEISTFIVMMCKNITKIEALIAIIWQLTVKGWPDEYYQWLGVDKNNITIENFNNIMKQKLN